jgi:NADPH-dependent curcumin reductase
MNLNNHRVLLTARPTALPGPEHFALDKQAARVPAPGELLLATRYLSIDPAMRVWMEEDPGYVAPIALGDPMRAGGVAEVIESHDPDFCAGDLVYARVGWQTHPTVSAATVQKLDLALGDALAWMGPLGLTGLTAYFGLLHVGQLGQKESVLVSAASGAVGQMVGQIARVQGAHTVGIAGGPEKCRIARNEHGFDVVIDYQNDSLKDAIPTDIDVYFDNVGGPILDAAIAKLALQGRVVVCGRISQTASAELYGVKNLGLLIGRRARIEGFVVSDFEAEFAAARRWIAARLKTGEIKQRVHLLDGLAACPDGLAMLFRGGNTGKLIVAL